eukprot:CAMPEP_0178983850 /NCGR_PEP_ID=MMETSP0795-20121207/1288_1 /TAXON_ID=88552 /ORGANISM="Amoebophrya sp., Strain Ameob2" /LENGTH=189 /DNA_ID=CAMNT_0020674667 /DNA_START=352 /DNA_END=920 /DNA_ORIENTATION=-
MATAMNLYVPPDWRESNPFGCAFAVGFGFSPILNVPRIFQLGKIAGDAYPVTFRNFFTSGTGLMKYATNTAMFAAGGGPPDDGLLRHEGLHDAENRREGRSKICDHPVALSVDELHRWPYRRHGGDRVCADHRDDLYHSREERKRGRKKAFWRPLEGDHHAQVHGEMFRESSQQKRAGEHESLLDHVHE